MDAIDELRLGAPDGNEPEATPRADTKKTCDPECMWVPLPSALNRPIRYEKCLVCGNQRPVNVAAQSKVFIPKPVCSTTGY